MTDKELLELAAKACWGSEIDDVCSIRWLEVDQCIGYTHADNQDHNGQDVELAWNPLLDDGDALRLLVLLGIEIRHVNGAAHAGRADHFWCTECWFPDGDKSKATRRTITRAAAELAKQEVKP